MPYEWGHPEPLHKQGIVEEESYTEQGCTAPHPKWLLARSARRSCTTGSEAIASSAHEIAMGSS